MEGGEGTMIDCPVKVDVLIRIIQLVICMLRRGLILFGCMIGSFILAHCI